LVQGDAGKQQVAATIRPLSAKIPIALNDRAVKTRLFSSTILLLYFSLEGVEIVVFAFILVLLRHRYTNGSEHLPVLLGP
jgi:hypothetical protein